MLIDTDKPGASETSHITHLHENDVTNMTTFALDTWPPRNRTCRRKSSKTSLSWIYVLAMIPYSFESALAICRLTGISEISFPSYRHLSPRAAIAGPDQVTRCIQLTSRAEIRDIV